MAHPNTDLIRRLIAPWQGATWPPSELRMPRGSVTGPRPRVMVPLLCDLWLDRLDQAAEHAGRRWRLPPTLRGPPVSPLTTSPVAEPGNS